MRTLGTDFVHWAFSRSAFRFEATGFKLSSGRPSSYLFNVDTLFDGEDLLQLASFYTQAINERGFRLPKVILASPYTAIPLATTFTTLNCDQRMRVAFYRKEAKKHGRGGLIVGKINPGETVGIIDDALTSGNALMSARNVILAQGGIPIWASVAFDRQEKGLKTDLLARQEFEDECGIPLVSIATLNDLGLVLNQYKSYAEILTA